MAAGLDIHALLNDWRSPLILAVQKKNSSLVKFLLDAGVTANNPPDLLYADWTPSPLSEAAQNGDSEMITLLLDRGADPNDSQALLEAVTGSHELVHVLLQAFHKRYPNGKRGYGVNALRAAISRGDLTIIESIWLRADNGYNSYYFYQALETTPLATAISKCEGESRREAELLLRLGADPNSIVERGCIPGHVPSMIPQITALLAAINTRSIPMIQLFLTHKADVNRPAIHGIRRTPLQQAAEIGNFDIVTLLLNHGADINARPARSGGGTALQLAAIKGWVGIASLLLENGADVNALPATVNGRTALEGAAEWGRPDIVKLLLNKGVKLDGEGYFYFKSALRLAKENKHLAVVQLLELHSPPAPVYSPRPVFTDSEGWTFWGLETEEGFEWVEESSMAEDELAPTSSSPSGTLHSPDAGFSASLPADFNPLDTAYVPKRTDLDPDGAILSTRRFSFTTFNSDLSSTDTGFSASGGAFESLEEAQ